MKRLLLLQILAGLLAVSLPGCQQLARISGRIGTTTPAQITAPSATTLKRQFGWNNGDMRPIGIWHLSDKSRVTAENPAGWLDGPNWQAAYLARAIPVTHRIGAQGVIVWDLEGASQNGLDANGAARMYIGSPDLAAAMNPGVDYVGFFKAIKAAGLIPGVCLRPHEYDPVAKLWRKSTDPYQTLARKAAFAYAWGCRIFYVDSNVSDVNGGEVLDPLIAARLSVAFKDCLWIWEHETPAYYLWSAPYMELRNGETAAPESVRSFIPTAFAAINISGGDVRGNASALLRGRSLFLVDSWCENGAVTDYCDVLKN
jgi:hypothetical protein